MNRKGFTLIELIAVIVILGIILVVAVPNLLSVYDDSKLKTEEIFLNNLSKSIDSYVSLNSDTLKFAFYLDDAKKEEQEGDVTVYKATITVHDIIEDGLIKEEDYRNAGNKDQACNLNGEIEVYRDSDYVYCHKIGKDALGCLTDKYKNGVKDDYVIDTCSWIEEVEQ